MTELASFIQTDDPRRSRILEGALKVFLAYGFQRTTMDDIARAAEISRPALYLQFRNKTDIYRALASEFMELAMGRAASSLTGEGPLCERLAKCFTCVFDMMGGIEESPHGADILDMKNSLAGDIMATGRATMRARIEDTIAHEAQRRGADLEARGYSAGALADLLLDAIDGLKARGPDKAELRETTHSFIRVIDRAVGG